MTAERRFFKGVIVAGIVGFAVLFGLAYLMHSPGLAAASMIPFGVSIFAGFIWFVQASADSLRGYGLGEGTANLYGEERAKFMFGEDCRKRSDE